MSAQQNNYLRKDDHHSDRQGPRYIAHKTDDGRQESVFTHLSEVAEMASEFAKSFGAESFAYTAGILHDIGKYSSEFQKRIREGAPPVDHSTAGAFVSFEQFKIPMISYSIAGHHGGLPDGGAKSDHESSSSLWGRLARASHRQIPDFSAYKDEIELPKLTGPAIRPVVNTKQDARFTEAFLTRMIFSCLVDADFLCTERFMQGGSRESLHYESMEELRDKLEHHIAGFFPPNNRLNAIRCQVLEDCKAAAGWEPGFFSLTVPTGAGKTLSSVRFALNHALSRSPHFERIVYAIPYTSIIDQNAKVYRDIFGSENVLEHHSNFDYQDFSEHQATGSDIADRLRLAAENWDAPIIVTTNVRLFESLYSNRTSRCRRLHNLARSIIILDEAQMLPRNQLLPCLRALIELVANYGCTVVLCTATQPSLNRFIEEKGFQVREIVPNSEKLYEELRRVTYQKHDVLSNEDLVTELAGQKQALCIVNSRKQAVDLYRSLKSEGVYNLTTLMYPAHRKEIIGTIDQHLKNGLPCVVIATSLVEAGVDLDFPVVYRAMAGVDSIMQAAGRCNRENTRLPEESIVHVFASGSEYHQPSEVNQKAAITQGILNDFDLDFGSPDIVKAYFDDLYYVDRDKLDETGTLAQTENSHNAMGIPFRKISDQFKLIDEQTYSVILPHPDVHQTLERLVQGRPERGDYQSLSQYSVSVYINQLRELKSAHVIEAIDGLDDTYVLSDPSCYSNETGLTCEVAEGQSIMIE